MNSGLNSLYSCIEKDERKATEPIVLMDTMLSDTSLGVVEDFDPNDTFLFMIPGLEGHHGVFDAMSKRLKIQAVTFQLTPTSDFEGIADIAQNILQRMKTTFGMKSKFYLLGYSFGVNIALELAALLETEGKKGVVYCVDSSPDALKVQLDVHLGEKTDDNIQNIVLKHVYKLLTGDNEQELEKLLDKTEDWLDKVNATVSKVKIKVSHSHEYMMDVINSLYNKIVLAKEYEPVMTLDSKVVLIKGKQYISLCRDYGLSKYSKQSVMVFDIESDHANVCQHNRLPTIVNKMLDTEILKAFSETNLCKSYTVTDY